MTQRRALGEILVRSGRITEADVAKALEYQRVSGGFFGAALVACGLVSEKEIDGVPHDGQDHSRRGVHAGEQQAGLPRAPERGPALGVRVESGGAGLKGEHGRDEGP